MSSYPNEISGRPYVLIPLIVAILTIPWIFTGFHYHDIGWNLSKAWMIVEHPGSAFWELSWLSSAVGGLWMKLGSYSMTWMRVGYIVGAALTFVLIYRILLFRYSPREAVIALIPTYLLYSAGFEQLILSYYTVPPLFAVLSLLLFFHGIRRGSDIAGYVWLILSGASFALMTQARVPSILLAVAFPVVSLIHARFAAEGSSRWVLQPVFVGVGFMLGTLALAGVLALWGNLDNALFGIVSTLKETATYGGGDNIHHPGRLLTDTLLRYGKLLLVGGAAVAAVWLFDQVFTQASRRVRIVSGVTVVAAVSALTVYFAINQLGMFPPSIGILSVLFLMQIWRSRQSRDPWEWTLYAVAGLYMVLMNVGSSNPQVGSFKFTVILLCPVVLIEFYRRESKYLSTHFLLVLLLANITALWLGTNLWNNIPTGEVGWEFDSDRLAFQHQSELIVREVDSVQKGLAEAGMRPGDTTLFYVDVPMLHFLTATVPAFTNPWVSNQSVGYPSLAKMREMVSQMEDNGTLPKYVVRARDVYLREVEIVPKVRFLDSLILAEGYDTVVQLERMVVLKRPDR